MQRAWEELTTEQDEDTMETNIALDEGPRIAARSFYSNLPTGSGMNKPKLGKLSDFLSLVKRDLPSIEGLIQAFKQKPASRPQVKRSHRETDLRSVSSQLTEDSGVESLKPKRSRRSQEGSGRRVGEKSKNSPLLRPRSGLQDVSNRQY